jgi:hypothetical protein
MFVFSNVECNKTKLGIFGAQILKLANAEVFYPMVDLTIGNLIIVIASACGSHAFCDGFSNDFCDAICHIFKNHFYLSQLETFRSKGMTNLPLAVRLFEEHNKAANSLVAKVIFKV